MSEIKSTLELIMEKTKGLTLSEGEKKALEREELEKKFRGLFQKCLDRVIEPADLSGELESLGADKGAAAREILAALTLSHMDPEGENEVLYQILNEALLMDPGPFKRRLEGCREKIQKERGRAADRLRQALAERGIRGSAVIPNENADPEWMHRLGELRKECRENLSAIPIRNPA